MPERQASPPTVVKGEDEVLPDEGGEALRRILASGIGPQVVWCPEGLATRIRRTAMVTRSSVTERMTARATGAAGSARNLPTPYVEPSGELETALAQLWSEALGVEGIGAEDDFFDLGGNSLFAVQLVSRISQRFAVDVSAASLFDARNLRTLSAVIEQALLEKISEMSDEQAQQALAAIGAR
jgi:acyl carrier protein